MRIRALSIPFFASFSFAALLFLVGALSMGSSILVLAFTDWGWNVSFASAVLGAAAFSTSAGLVVLRFGIRTFPLYVSGARNQRAIAMLPPLILLIPGSCLLLAYDLFQDAVPSAEDSRPDAFFMFGFERFLDGLMQALAQVFVLEAILLSLSLILPLALLLRLHLNAGAWMRAPYVLFLRPFTSASNAAALGPLARRVPKDLRVVFVAAPERQSDSWDPLTLGFAGFSLWRPLASLPLYLRCDGPDWRPQVRSLATYARGVVIDISISTESMKEEVAIVRALGPEARVIWLCRAGALWTEVPEPSAKNQELVLYQESWLATLGTRLATCVLTYSAAATVLHLLTSLLISELLSSPRYDDLFDRSLPVRRALCGLAAVGATLLFNQTVGYSRASARLIRSRLGERLQP